MDSKWLIFIIHLIISEFIFVPVFIYWTVRFYQQKEHIAINKRVPSLTIAYCLFAILQRAIEKPLFLFIITYSTTHGYVSPEQIIHYQRDQFSPTIVAIFTIWIVIFSLLQTSTTWILLLRYWSLYFNIAWTQSTMNKTWKIHINPLEIERDWFLRHKSTYGNYRYMLKRMAAIYLILVLVIVILFLFLLNTVGEDITSLLTALLFICPVLGILILSCKIRKFKDDFYVIKEFNIITRFIIAGILLYVVVGNMIPTALKLDPYTKGFMGLLQSTFLSPFFMYFQTIYVLKIVRGNVDVDGNNKSTELTNEVSNANAATVKKKPLNDIMRNMNDFEDFMHHLSKEWSMEILLAFVEMTQFQSKIKEEYQDMQSDKMTFTALQDALLENEQIPKSFIVYEDVTDDVKDKMTELKIRACGLYDKYIVGKELEINISHEQREQLHRFMDNSTYFLENVNMNETELFMMYDDIIEELSTLLGYSHCRYKFGA